MKISVITVSYNSEKTITKTIESVLNQSHNDLEYLVIDGNSHDGTADIVRSFGTRIKFISEPDSGMYEALNKGIKLASGEIIGIVNSDDFLCDNNVISEIVKMFDSNTDAVYGDVQFINDNGKIVRYYSSKKFHSGKFRFGFMPAHPGFYARRELFEKYGYYKTDYQIAADFELLLRFMYTHRIRTKYMNLPVVKMSTGGISTRNIFSNITLNNEIIRACRENGLKTNLLLVYSKYFSKVFQFTNARKKAVKRH